MWREPLFLWLLLLVPLAVLFFVHARRQRRAALEAFAEARLLDRIAVGHDSPRPLYAAATVVVAIAFAVIALAGPKWGFHWEEVRREGIDLMLRSIPRAACSPTTSCRTVWSAPSSPCRISSSNSKGIASD